MLRWLPSCFMALVAVPLAAAPVGAAARLAIADSVFDFGVVEQGVRVEHVFKVKNEGDAAASIVGVDRVCACTVGTAHTRVVAPGKEAWITVALDTRALAGAIAKAVTVRTDAASAREIRLVVQGTVLADLVAEPDVLYLGEVRRGADVERAAAVRPGRPNGAARVAGVAARGPFVSPRVVDEGGFQRIVVRIADTAPAGRFRDEIVVRTPDGVARMVLPVFGIVRSELQVEPSFVRLAAWGGDDAAVVQLVNHGSTPVTVQSVRVPSDVATYRLETIRRGFEYAVRVSLRRGLPPRTLDDRIEIVTDHPTERRINVPLHAVTAQAARARY